MSFYCKLSISSNIRQAVNISNLIMDKPGSLLIAVCEKSDHIDYSQKLMNLLRIDYRFKAEIGVVIHFIVFDVNN